MRDAILGDLAVVIATWGNRFPSISSNKLKIEFSDVRMVSLVFYSTDSGGVLQVRGF